MNIEKKRVRDLIPASYNPRKDLKPGDLDYEKLKRLSKNSDTSNLSSGINLLAMSWVATNVLKFSKNKV